MFGLTTQERRVILFLLSMALLGLGINFFCKAHSPYAKFMRVDNRATKIDLNRAGLPSLLNLPGVTAKLAENIIAYRNANGPFKNLEELKEVKGIGDYRYEKLKELFFVE